MFAERGFDSVTVAEIAAEASVAVQTVFNHFTTKEDLFFDRHASWVDAPVNAVRSRPLHISPLTALRHYLTEAARETVRFEDTLEGRSYTRCVGASAALSARERELVHRAELRLGDALALAWADGVIGVSSAGPEGPALASLTAATWLAAVRVLVVAQRPVRGGGEARADLIADLIDRVLRGRQDGILPRPEDTGDSSQDCPEVRQISTWTAQTALSPSPARAR